MRVLLLSSTAYPVIGGVENSLRHISRELVRKGHEVKVFCFQMDPSEPLQTECDGVEIIRCKYRLSRWPHRVMKNDVELVRREIGRVLSSFMPDVIWSRKSTMGLGVALSDYEGRLFNIFPTTARMNSRGLFLNTAGIPLIRRMMLMALWPIVYRTHRRIDRELLKRCQPVVFSDNMQNQLKKSYGHFADKTRVIHPGVDTRAFSYESGSRLMKKIESQYGLSPDEVIILYVGRLTTAKNIPMLIDAVNCLKSNARLVLVGSGGDEARLRDYAAKRGPGERVFFAGRQSDLLAGFYAMAKVCVLPSTIESFGQAYLESLACGTPVVGFASDGNRVLTATEEIVRDGVTGRVVRQVSPKALADGIDDILTLSPTEYKTMSQRGVEDVTRRFSWSNFVEEMLAL